MNPPPRPAPRGVLVAEDDPQVLSIIIQFLEALGVPAIAAGGCDEAVSALRERAGEIGAAILDLNMPGGDGLETRRRLHAIRPGLPCCLASGEGRAAGGAPEGFCCALDKPFTLEQVREAVAAMRRHAAQGAAPEV
jgi:DNA-binding NtrC family response regulator